MCFQGLCSVKIVAACKRHGVSLMSSLGQTPEVSKDPVATAKKFYEDGGRILILGMDLGAWSKSCGEAATLSANIKKKI